MQMGKFNLLITNLSPMIMSWFALKTRGIVHCFLQPYNHAIYNQVDLQWICRIPFPYL